MKSNCGRQHSSITSCRGPERFRLRPRSRSRISAASNDSFEWLVGGYYTNEKALIKQDFGANVPGTDTPISFPFVLGDVRLDSRYREVAGFANATRDELRHLTAEIDDEDGIRRLNAHGWPLVARTRGVQWTGCCRCDRGMAPAVLRDAN